MDITLTVREIAPTLKRGVFAIAILLATTNIMSAEGTDSKADVRIRAIAAAYAANINSFSTFSCSFTVRYGYVAPGADPISAPLSEIQATADCLWIKDGKLERYQVDRQVDLPKSKKFGSYGVMLPPESILSDGELQLRHSKVLSVCEILGHHKPTRPVLMTPLDLIDEMGSTGELNPGTMVEQYLGKPNSPIHFRYLERDNSLEKLAMEIPGDDISIIYSLDPSRGFLPATVLFFVGKRMSKEIHIHKMSECAKGRWFPSAIRVISRSSGRPFIKELNVNDLIVDEKPSLESFAIDVPKRTQLHAGIPSSGSRIDDMHIHVSNLKDVLLMTNNTAKSRSPLKLSQVEDVGSRKWLAIIVLTAIPASWIAYIGWRRRYA